MTVKNTDPPIVTRPVSVQLMLARLAKDACYKDGVPKSWMGGPLESGEAETALIDYVEELERRSAAKTRRAKKK